MPRRKIALLLPKARFEKAFTAEDLEKLEKLGEVKITSPEEITPSLAAELIESTEACITGRGCCVLSKEILDRAPDLKIIAHVGGSIKPILSPEVWRRGLVLTSAAPVQAKAVAEFTLGLIILSLKRVFSHHLNLQKGHWREEKEMTQTKNLYQSTIGIIGASLVGRNLIRLLQNFSLTILLFDPFVDEREARKLGVWKTSLEELMEKSDVVSLHAPALKSTQNMITRENLKLMKTGATFINTARGTIVNENDLVAELKTGRIFACLDVFEPEPPAPDHPLRKLPNVLLTPHIAGLVNEGYALEGRWAIESIEKYFRGEKLPYVITEEMISRIA